MRVIAASHKDVPGLVQGGAFREDLYYRLNIIKIEIPPLCERRTDIPLLVENCLGRLNAHKGKQVSGISAEVLARLMNHSYPGNIRELENILEHAYVLCRGNLIEERHLPLDFMTKTNRDSGQPADPDSPLNVSERNLIRETLKTLGGNRVETARKLRLSRTTLWRKIKKHDLRRDRCLAPDVSSLKHLPETVS
ncbi:MAG: sigma 54-interacting transcriptional regulator [Desulfobacterales bacterium]|nr:sigma 54-interacting transcriptional regulator [Desulfobacterales bacterium]